MKKQLWLVLGLLAAVGCAQPAKIVAERNVAAVEENDIMPLDERDAPNVIRLQEKGGKNNSKLEKCGDGVNSTVWLERVNGNLQLRVKEATCGSYQKNNEPVQNLGGQGSTGRTLSVSLKQTPGFTNDITIGSKNFFKSGTGMADRILVYIPVSAPKLTVLDLRNWSGTAYEQTLPNCGGTIRASINQGAVNIQIANTNCGLYDFLQADGANLNYNSKPIPASGGRHAGSVAVLKRWVEYGNNGVILRVYNTGGRDDRILVKFKGGY